jgi:hypothetical protein
VSGVATCASTIGTTKEAAVHAPFEHDPIAFLDEHAPGLVAAYFDDRAPGRFSGRRFERLAGGGDHAARRDHFDATDLVAITTLSVQVPAEAAIGILESEAEHLSVLLREIPADRDLWDEPENTVAPGSASDRLWNALCALDGVGWVIAGKLCARKRPRLLPVYDAVVRDALGAAHPGFWRALHRRLQDERAVDRVRDVRREAGVGDDISLLRVLDVAIWMRSRAQISLPAPPRELPLPSR